jgi:hypothetical protein
MNNIYTAIMKAADHIERHPRDFDFSVGDIPSECGTPGCALGWIGHFAGKSGTFMDVCECLGLVEPIADKQFYRRMDAVVYALPYHDDWYRSAKRCAHVLRLYAAKYHAPAKPVFTGLPDIVREIFTKPTAFRETV